MALLCSVSVNLAELWRAPSKGGEGNFEGVKPRQEPRPGRGRYGARTRDRRDSGVKEEGWKVQGGRWKGALDITGLTAN